MIHGLEWLFITLILFILILWDPGKIPQIARALAEARKEYEKATATVQELVEDVEEEAEKIWNVGFAREFAEEKLSGMLVLRRLRKIFGEMDLVKAEKKLFEALKKSEKGVAGGA